MSLPQMQAEGLCLRYPDNLGVHQTVTHEDAVNMLLRSIRMSNQVPYSWGYIDKPPGAFYACRRSTFYRFDASRWTTVSIVPSGSCIVSE
jgi:hypothetical protein